MKRLIIGLALVVATLAAPLVEDVDPAYILDDEGTVSSANFTASAAATRAVGWGGFGGGTTGGNGGQEWTVWDAFALRDAVNVRNNNDRRVVNVRGRINLDTLFVSSPGVRLRVGAYTTVRGGDRNAEITGGGLQVANVHQVIITNLKIFNAISYAPGERPNGSGGITNLGSSEYSEIDAVEVSGSTHVWIDHCEFSDDPWDSNRGPRRHDGQIDIVRGADLVTVSNSIFSNHFVTSLIGNGDGMGHIDNGRLRTTFFANWFRGVQTRTPAVRFGQVHVLNNLMTDISFGRPAVGIGAGARVYLERNVFRNCRRSWGYTGGVPNPAGFLYELRNSLINSGRDTGIPNNVGWNPWGTYPYSAIAIGQVEDHVRRHAGIL